MLRPEIFEGKKVLVTGHTGFKGAWLTHWLLKMNAEVIGYSLQPPTEPNLFDLSGIEEKITHLIADVRDFDTLNRTVQEYQPDLIFHLAAQSLVLTSYQETKETFDINVGGTTNLLESLRSSSSVQAAVIVTTDKCYENQEWEWGYREIDRLGGNDPYSASKAMTELLVSSYRKSHFADGPAVATARAGNVIGGGDFSENRLIPDLVRSLADKSPVSIRSPKSIRPWLYVLDALSGYLLLAQKLLTDGKKFAEAWNFGPLEQQGVEVDKIVNKFFSLWEEGDWIDVSNPCNQKEMRLLRLSWEKAAEKLNWQPRYTWEEGIEETVDWYQSCSSSTPSKIQEKCMQQVDNYALSNDTYQRCLSH